MQPLASSLPTGSQLRDHPRSACSTPPDRGNLEEKTREGHKNMKPHHKIVILYVLGATAWILVSDWVVALLSPGNAPQALMQNIKGLLFVAVTGLLLFVLVRRYFRQMEAAQAEKRDIFQSTMAAVNLVLRNFLSDMTYFRMVAEDTPFIEKNVLTEYDRVIQTTSEKLGELSELHDIDSQSIRSWSDLANHDD